MDKISSTDQKMVDRKTDILNDWKIIQKIGIKKQTDSNSKTVRYIDNRHTVYRQIYM